jgi:outer membrane protein OmpA-like peptidoglycan-associated protein
LPRESWVELRGRGNLVSSMPRHVPLSLIASLTAAMAPAIAAAAPAEDPPAAEGEPDAAVEYGAKVEAPELDAPEVDADASSESAASSQTPATTEVTTPPPATGKPRLSKRRDRKWIDRWAPERNTFEGGIWAGIMIPARDLELFEADLDLPRQGFRPLARVAPDLGLRAGYYPIRHFGIEVEGGVMPTKADGLNANLWSVRGHVVGQLGLWSVTPFALVGAGAFGVASERYSVGNDVDPSLHLGLGLKTYLNRYTMLRLDLRDTITSRRGVAKGATNTIEILLGFSIVLGRKRDVDDPSKPPPVELDRDGDGVLDKVDQCPDEPGPKPTGCPTPGDRDGDGFLDPDDKCPDDPGIAPDGCPDRDPDKDGILDPDDKCPTDPENKNGFEDTDGCPDAIPSDIEQFEGTLEGVNFDFGKDTLRPESKTKLDKAVEIMTKHATVKVEISGHTDSVGGRDANMDLSQRRADAVKRYLVEKGIAADRIETRGAGPDEPIDSNKSDTGRAKNRRIEFKVLR